jgi:hypothetical protein
VRSLDSRSDWVPPAVRVGVRVVVRELVSLVYEMDVTSEVGGMGARGREEERWDEIVKEAQGQA